MLFTVGTGTPIKCFLSSYMNAYYMKIYCIVKHANRDTHTYLVQININELKRIAFMN